MVVRQHVDERGFAHIGSADKGKFGFGVRRAFLVIGIAGDKSCLGDLHRRQVFGDCGLVFMRNRLKKND